MKITTLEISDKKILMTAEFRPIADFSGKNISRYHAAARFINADNFLDSPEPLIDLCEETEFSNNVADFLFDTICNLLKKKEQLTLAFSLPYQRLNDMDYLTTLYHQCLQNDIQPQHIEIAISEKFSGDKLINSQPFLNKAKEYGFILSLDNFGIGDLQINGLHSLPFDSIKIDRAIIHGISTDKMKQSTLQRLISDVIPTGIEVICDGAERTSDLALLKRFHADIKGYMLRRPLTCAQLQLLEDF
ncbi:EAL domain-containing protein [Kosakonia sp. BYX6]|uniref:EAL domain-containing protein n=1 Tax=Kosakonia calanthes TaxID=3139408 RepID=A0ABZ3B2C0_9ENTR